MTWPSFTSYFDAGVLIPLDLFFAERVLREEFCKQEETMAFLAFLLAFSRQGHLALPLDEIEVILNRIPIQAPCNMSAFARLVREGAQSLPSCCSPFVHEREGIYYLEKNWVCEKEIASHILRMLQVPISPLACETSFEHLSNEQTAAILNAARHPLSLLFGGPGTGKTYTAARLIQAFLEQDTEHAMRVVIAAPTGKAAAQLETYLRRFLPDEKRIRSGTCHALLGLKKSVSSMKEPLHADVILIDECSMIDAPLFAHLLSSVLEGSRLILIGDPDQLPSVDAGSIFADLVAAAQNGMPIPFIQLTKSLRSERQDILDFAQCIRTGRSEDAQEMLVDQRIQAVRWIDLDLKECRSEAIHRHLWESFKERFPSFFTENPDPKNSSFECLSSISEGQDREKITDPERIKHKNQVKELMSAIDAFRLLSCMRQGSFGVDAINQFFAEQFFKNAPMFSYWAIPILIAKNDYALQLYNGDAGMLIRRITSSSSLTEVTQEDYALFPDRACAENLRKIPALALPAFEWSYCLSVHKSQGSEYDEVFVIIPQGSDVFGREILYTAATRSKQFITCACSLDVIEKVIQNSARKISGLSARLKKELTLEMRYEKEVFTKCYTKCKK